jgi:hypothetical protein
LTLLVLPTLYLLIERRSPSTVSLPAARQAIPVGAAD